MPPSLLEVSLGGVGVAPPAVPLVPPPLALVNVAAAVEEDALALPHPGHPLTLKIENDLSSNNILVKNVYLY